ncbi:unnamed protein product [Rotaria magnacalcarata]|uniref:Deoxynucleoside kinase domain-containing protein n=1 Tax=Rotaria magnacalcarata TaxID=392030 RepID=A0A8S2LRJ1_9BILA|nr:unnamed protein product [Rotaria magnacalcarata]
MSSSSKKFTIAVEGNIGSGKSSVLAHLANSSLFYLRATPETCLQRIHARNRSEEESISLDYLQKLHECHEEWLINRHNTNLSIPILVVDANQTKERVYNDTNTHVENLVSY